MEVVHQAMLLRTSLPIIQNRAEELRENVLELAKTRDDIDHQLKELKGASTLYSDQRDLLDSLIDRKANLLQETDAERKRIAQRLKRLTRQAATLKELFDRLEAERPPPPPEAPAQSQQTAKPGKEQQTAAAYPAAAQRAPPLSRPWIDHAAGTRRANPPLWREHVLRRHRQGHHDRYPPRRHAWLHPTMVRSSSRDRSAVTGKS